MRILWRTLPSLAVPAAVGLGLAYLATSFLPRPRPELRPPEELRAHGLGYGEESPLRAILERNVLQLESPPFAPPDSPLPPPQDPAAELAAIALPAPSLPGAELNGTQVGPSSPGVAKGMPAVINAPPPTAEDLADIAAFQLLGAVPGGARPMAIVQAEGRTYALHVGEEARGWRLEEVRAGRALLRRGGRALWIPDAPRSGGTP